MSFEVVLEEPDVQYYVSAYGDGKWVVAGGSSIASATDPFGTWTTGDTDFADAVIDLVYGGGYWVASTPAHIYTATDPLGSWTEAADLTETVGSYTSYLAFDGDEWGRLDVYGHLLAATDPTGSWTLVEDFGGTFLLGVIAVLNGEWVVCGWDGPDTLLYSAPSASGPWTLRANLGSTGIVAGLGVSPEGYFVSVDSIYTSSSLDGPWVAADMAIPALVNLIYGDDDIYAGVAEGAQIVSAERLGDEVDSEPLPPMIGWDTLVRRCTAQHDGIWVASGFYFSYFGLVIAGTPEAAAGGTGWGVLL